MTWRVATRRSALARAQAQQVADALAAASARPAELVPLTTTGDEHPDRAVESFDAKGLFVDGIREAVRDGRADIAVHSYKDLPTIRSPGLVIGAVPTRLDPRDALVTREGHGVARLPRLATVGTSSARRRAQLARARRDLVLQPVRGNVDTRLRRVADGDLDGVVLALAGLARLGPTEHAVNAVVLEHGECLHAPAQGALAIECREDDDATLEALHALDDTATRALIRAERALLEEMSGGCTAPIGAHAAYVSESRIELLGMVSDPSGTNLYRASHQGAAHDPAALGVALAITLLDAGGRDVLDRLRA